MPVKKKEVKETPKQEPKNNIKEKLDELEEKISALFQGFSEMNKDLKRIKDRMGV